MSTHPSGTLLLLTLVLTLAPCETRIFTISKACSDANSVATCNGVCPCPSSLFTSAPHSTSILTAFIFSSLSWENTAWCKAVPQPSSIWLMSTPAFSISLIFCSLPYSAALSNCLTWSDEFGTKGRTCSLWLLHAKPREERKQAVIIRQILFIKLRSHKSSCMSLTIKRQN